jgi:hypothetical protein
MLGIGVQAILKSRLELSNIATRCDGLYFSHYARQISLIYADISPTNDISYSNISRSAENNFQG